PDSVIGGAEGNRRNRSSVRGKPPIPIERLLLNLRYFIRFAHRRIKDRKYTLFRLQLAEGADGGWCTRTLKVNDRWGLKHDLGRAPIDRRSHQPYRLRIIAWIRGYQIQNLSSVWIQPANRFFLRTTDRHFCRGFIYSFSKNVVCTGSIRDEQHSLVVERPVERKVVGLVERKPARCAESRSFGRKLGDVDINLWPSPVKYETLAIGGDAGFHCKAIAAGDSSSSSCETAGAQVYAGCPKVRAVLTRRRFIHGIQQPPIRQPDEPPTIQTCFRENDPFSALLQIKELDPMFLIVGPMLEFHICDPAPVGRPNR